MHKLLQVSRNFRNSSPLIVILTQAWKLISFVNSQRTPQLRFSERLLSMLSYLAEIPVFCFDAAVAHTFFPSYETNSHCSNDWLPLVQIETQG